MLRKKKFLIAGAVASVALIAIGLGVGLGVGLPSSSKSDSLTHLDSAADSSLIPKAPDSNSQPGPTDDATPETPEQTEPIENGSDHNIEPETPETNPGPDIPTDTPSDDETTEEIPEIPDEPEVIETPEFPDNDPVDEEEEQTTPVTPDTPTDDETTEVPEIPNEPEVPDTPEFPDTDPGSDDDEPTTPVITEPNPDLNVGSDSEEAPARSVMDEYIATFPQVMRTEMATREMRYHHYLWHQVREGWNKFPDATKEAFRNIGWEPPNPARNYAEDGSTDGVFDNFAGEEFLYMHRKMIESAKEILIRNNESIARVTGWDRIPAPGDLDWPVPPNITIPNNAANTAAANNRKTDNFYTRSLLPDERRYTDPEQLRKMNLSELGMRLEVTTHAYLHMRWSSENPIGYRNTYRGTIPYMDPKWDDPLYDWLGDSYSSHVNPLFWKIHGWVDNRIEDWKAANNVTTIDWKGTWRGGPMENLGSVVNVSSSLRGKSVAKTAGSTASTNLMEEALKILWESGVEEVGVADEVRLPPWTD